jgi:hypothetical protein
MKATGKGMQEVWRELEKMMPCLVGTERGMTRRWNGGGHAARPAMVVVAAVAATRGGESKEGKSE